MAKADEKGAPTGLALGVGTKLAAWTVLVLFLVTALVANELIAKERENLVTAKTTAAGMIADMLSSSLSAPLDFADDAAAQEGLNQLGSNRALAGAVAWGSGPEPVARLGNPPPGLMELRGSEARAMVLADEVRVVRPVLRADGHRLGTLALSLSLREENEAFAAARMKILQYSALLAVGTAVLLLALSRWQIIQPLDRLVLAARRLGDGDRSVRVESRSNDELGRLAHVFNRMTRAIEEREERLQMVTQSLRELFDNMRQAILVFGADGTLEGEVSKQARALFGDRVGPGKRVDEVLYGEAADTVEGAALREWVATAFEMGLGSWSEVQDLAPEDAWIHRSPEDRRYVRFEFRPIESGGRIARMMLLATDETELKTLETRVKMKDEDHARQMAAMRRLITGGGQVFVNFVESSRRRVDRCREILEMSARLSPADVDEILQHAHTMKGEARSFDLERLADELASMEDEIAAVQARARSERGIDIDAHAGSWRSRLLRVQEELSRAQEVFVSASPIGRAVLDQITVSRTDVHRLGELLGDRADEAGEIARRLAARPFGEIVAPLVESLPRWAEKLGKRARLEVDGREMAIPPEVARVLPGVLTHLVRNALAHGIETPAVRTQLNKPEVGVVRATCVAARRAPTIVVEDDGQGIDFDTLAARAGLGSSDLKAAAALLFKPGVSTAEQVTDMAGRGVGLSAARAELESVGWTLDVDPTRRFGTAFVIRLKSRPQTPSSVEGTIEA